MRNLIPRNSNQRAKSGQFNNGSRGYQGAKQNSSTQKKGKSDYCWNFNKGIPCKFGSKCRFVERCKYCDSPQHGVHACSKLQKKTGDGGGSKAVQETSKQ